VRLAGSTSSLCDYWISNESPRVIASIVARAPVQGGIGRFILAVNGVPVAWTSRTERLLSGWVSRRKQTPLVVHNFPDLTDLHSPPDRPIAIKISAPLPKPAVNVGLPCRRRSMKGSFTGGFPARRAAGRPYPAPNVCSGLLDPRLWSGSYTGPPAIRAEALDRGRSSAAISDLAQARRGGSWQCLVAGPCGCSVGSGDFQCH
jgi:hypothetical protein